MRVHGGAVNAESLRQFSDCDSGSVKLEELVDVLVGKSWTSMLWYTFRGSDTAVTGFYLGIMVRKLRG